MDKKIGHPKAAQNIQGNHNDNSTHSQRLRLLQRLRECNLITSEERWPRLIGQNVSCFK